ncbi:MAG: retroviral-like aspartic protease family protein [Erythrobacter sp.]
MHYLWGPTALALAMAQPVSDQASKQAISPNLSDPNTEVIDLGEDRNQRLTVPVTIDGSGPYDFMIDTGSQATVVTHEINEALGLESLGMATLVGMASRRSVQLVELDSLEVGERTFHNLAAPVLERNHIGADGIIGLDSLQDLRVMIDFRNDTIAVADVESDFDRKGFEIVVRARHKLGQLLITDATIEGVRTTVIIDTGAQASLGNLALRDRLRAKRAQDVVTTDVNGVSLMGKMSYARTFTIQNITVRDLPITYADAPAFAALGLGDEPVLSLGMQHLKMFDRVAIDFSKQRILFDVPRHVERDLRRKRFNRLQ